MRKQFQNFKNMGRQDLEQMQMKEILEQMQMEEILEQMQMEEIYLPGPGQ